MEYQWNWALFLQPSFDGETSWLMLILSGLGNTLLVSFGAWLIALCLGTLVGSMRTLMRPNHHPIWEKIGLCYVELFRNIPLLVQFFLWYFVLPELVPSVKQFANSVDPQTFQLIVSIICLGLFTSARIAEQVRSGLQSLPKGQRYAGQAMGFSERQTYQYILLPMAFRIIMPPLTSETVNLVKNSSVALTIGLVELTFRTREMGESTFAFFEAFSAATLIYITLSLSVSYLMRRLEKKWRVPGLLTQS